MPDKRCARKISGTKFDANQSVNRMVAKCREKAIQRENNCRHTIARHDDIVCIVIVMFECCSDNCYLQVLCR